MSGADNTKARWTLEHAMEIVRVGANAHTGYRSYDGTGGIWVGSHNGIADAMFTDWGLARATSIILNAVLRGELVPRTDTESTP